MTEYKYSPFFNYTFYGGEAKPEIEQHIHTPDCICNPRVTYDAVGRIKRIEHNIICAPCNVETNKLEKCFNSEIIGVKDSLTEMRKNHGTRRPPKRTLDPALRDRVLNLLA